MAIVAIVNDAADEGKEGANNAALEEKHRKHWQKAGGKLCGELEPAVEAVKKEKAPEWSELLDKGKESFQLCFIVSLRRSGGYKHRHRNQG